MADTRKVFGMNKRGRPSRQRGRVEARAQEMRESGQRVNKSRIARELHIPIRTVFRILPAVGA